MDYRNAACRAALVAAPLLGGMAGYFLVTGGYVAAFVAMALVVACMELRVRLGLRLPRKGFFYMHLACGVLLMIALAALAFAAPFGWLVYASLFLFIAVMLSGGALLMRQVQTFS